MTSRGINVIVQTSEEFLSTTVHTITRSDLVTGDFSWTRAALNKLGIPMP